MQCVKSSCLSQLGIRALARDIANAPDGPFPEEAELAYHDACADALRKYNAQRRARAIAAAAADLTKVNLTIMSLPTARRRGRRSGRAHRRAARSRSGSDDSSPAPAPSPARRVASPWGEVLA